MIPLLSTNTIPASAARSGTRGRPVRPRLVLRGFGSNGSTSSHSSSLTNRSTQDRLDIDRHDQQAAVIHTGPTHRLLKRRLIRLLDTDELTVRPSEASTRYRPARSRLSTIFEAVGRDYRRHLPSTDPVVLDTAYHAGHAYAEIGKPHKALPQLRFYVQNAAASSQGDTAERVLESRYVIAQMLATDGQEDEAVTELESIRPLLCDAFGVDSTQVRNLDKQISRLRSAMQ